MSQQVAVQFPTASRIHMGLAVRSVARSIPFYALLLGKQPTKRRPGYARFEVAEPPVNLSLNEASGPWGPVHPAAHYGIQVKSSEAVQTAEKRLSAAGIATRVEEQVTCCYAVQKKVWAVDPDGNQWEVYVVLDDSAGTPSPGSTECCPADCCGGRQDLAESLTGEHERGAPAAVEVGSLVSGCCTQPAS